VLMGPPTVWLVVLFLIPLGAMIYMSFQAGSFGADAQRFSLESYQRFLVEPALQRLLLSSVWVALVVSVLSVALAYPIAYYLCFEAGPLKYTLLSVIIVPAWTSFLLRVLAWKLILGSDGVLSSFLMALGVIDQPAPFLLYSKGAVIVTLVYIWIPFVALPIFVALDRIDPKLPEAAADLGATPFETFLRVILPLSLPGVLAGFVLVFIPTIGEYVTPALVGGTSGVLYGNLIWDQFLRALNWPMGAVMSVIMLLAVLLPFILFSRAVRYTQLVDLYDA